MRTSSPRVRRKQANAHRLIASLDQVLAEILAGFPGSGDRRLPHHLFQCRHQTGQTAGGRCHEHRAHGLTGAGRQNRLQGVEQGAQRPLAGAAKLLRTQQQILKPVRRLNQQLHDPPLPGSIQGIFELIVKRLFG